MARQQIRDRKGSSIGSIDDQPTKQIAYNKKGSRAGWYDKKRDLTFDRRGSRFGTGNQLAALIILEND